MNPTKIIMIRHAESAFNLAQRVAKQTSSEVVNFADESLNVKFDPCLMDCSLTDAGVQQAIYASQEMSNIDIKLVLVSPLRRAIETAYYMFRDHPSQPRLLVEPMLREMISSSCDFGAALGETMQKYPQFDYSRVLRKSVIDAPNMWSLEFMINQEHAQKAKEFIYERCQDYNQEGPELFLEFFRQFPVDSFEDFEDTRQRVIQLHECLKKHCQSLEGRVACVTHSRTLQTLSASKFDDDGKCVDGRWWKNCESYEIEL